MRDHKSSRRAQASAPAITSEWPLRYLVAECITISAPSFSGCANTGVATVESTASIAPASCAMAATAAMSVIDHSGLDGVSTHTSLVSPGRIAARSAPGSVMSMQSAWMPSRGAASSSQCRNAQYISRGATT
jgi:hypothetical protein